jgi:hypothetical protein
VRSGLAIATGRTSRFFYDPEIGRFFCDPGISPSLVLRIGRSFYDLEIRPIFFLEMGLFFVLAIGKIRRRSPSRTRSTSLVGPVSIVARQVISREIAPTRRYRGTSSLGAHVGSRRLESSVRPHRMSPPPAPTTSPSPTFRSIGKGREHAATLL